MINISNKVDCVGCSACVQKCPKQCISFIADSEGFLYPQVDLTQCIDCGLCEQVCPVINQNSQQKPIKVLAAYNPDEKIRMSSSSGGIFTMLAELVIDQGGIVFGAKFNNLWQVYHTYVETKDKIKAFRGSKYVQSNIGNSFRETEQFLKQGKTVLFSGTPCQIAGLHNFLRKDYPNLITVDFICHGVPSPGVFRTYLQGICHKTNCELSNIKQIQFRDKTKGWNNYSLKIIINDISSGKEIIITNDLKNDPFLKGFINDLYLRPSCHKCPTKKLSSKSDITIGDYWGYSGYDDNKGISAVLINTEKGQHIYDTIKPINKLADFEDLSKRNPAINSSPSISKKRPLFFNNNFELFEEKVSHLCKSSMSEKIKKAFNHLRGKASRILKNFTSIL